jgi:hypothetical protein
MQYQAQSLPHSRTRPPESPRRARRCSPTGYRSRFCNCSTVRAPPAPSIRACHAVGVPARNFFGRERGGEVAGTVAKHEFLPSRGSSKLLRDAASWVGDKARNWFSRRRSPLPMKPPYRSWSTSGGPTWGVRRAAEHLRPDCAHVGQVARDGGVLQRLRHIDAPALRIADESVLAGWTITIGDLFRWMVLTGRRCTPSGQVLRRG